MYFIKVALLASLLALVACDQIEDDLNPSSEDLRPDVVAGSDGTAVGQQAVDFTLKDTLGNDFILSNEYPLNTATILYFTMWCPVCDSHMSYMRQYMVAQYPDVEFLFIDYVTGTVSGSRQTQISNGYTDFTVLVDATNAIQNIYNATMGTVVVIDNSGIIKMNEDFKDAVKITATLDLL